VTSVCPQPRTPNDAASGAPMNVARWSPVAGTGEAKFSSLAMSSWLCAGAKLTMLWQ
jgi:hypothetical protein